MRGVYFVKNGHTILFFYLPSPVQFLFNRRLNWSLGLAFSLTYGRGRGESWQAFDIVLKTLLRVFNVLFFDLKPLFDFVSLL